MTTRKTSPSVPSAPKPAEAVDLHLQKKRGNPNWVAGTSGNPGGRPVASRQRLSESLITDLASEWQAGGAEVLSILRKEDPATFAKLAFGILPRDVLVKTEVAPPGNLQPQEWAQLRHVLNLIEQYAPNGAEPSEIFTVLENALHVKYAIEPPPY